MYKAKDDNRSLSKLEFYNKGRGIAMYEAVRLFDISVDGIKISGKIENVKETLQKLGYDYYESDSKGLVLVQEMDDCHLRNSIIKRSKEVLDSFRNQTPHDFAKRIVTNGLDGGNDRELMILCRELASRYNENYESDDENYDFYGARDF